jgi:predicted transcriptional regulator
MTHNNNRKNINEVRIKFLAPNELKEALQLLANERNITLSALLRLVTSEYVKRTQTQQP